ncbi:hypothetical protein M422DRAFT_35115 [Sphaerobolus stellatus SS14]|uniref:Uncharacterized protein n=1 Tax=Sphaerobolus stellatus (strain SS14) TaxID=990650 RepID=A0A0C9UHB5_SPHS4|nr:hypothetical protein M422DRAFT_35115 [Sphaerobolus stellatus SS14]
MTRPYYSPPGPEHHHHFHGWNNRMYYRRPPVRLFWFALGGIAAAAYLNSKAKRELNCHPSFRWPERENNAVRDVQNGSSQASPGEIWREERESLAYAADFSEAALDKIIANAQAMKENLVSRRERSSPPQEQRDIADRK